MIPVRKRQSDCCRNRNLKHMKNHTFSPTGIIITLALMAMQGLAQSIYEPYTFVAGGNNGAQNGRLGNGPGIRSKHD
jgi:hypothetical protein